MINDKRLRRSSRVIPHKSQRVGIDTFTQELHATTPAVTTVTVESIGKGDSTLSFVIYHLEMTNEVSRFAKAFGQLVQLGFEVTVFTPAAYRRRSLRRPSWSPHLVAGFALRCFQRLSDPDADTRRCTWRYNRQTGGRSTTVLSY